MDIPGRKNARDHLIARSGSETLKDFQQAVLENELFFGKNKPPPYNSRYATGYEVQTKGCTFAVTVPILRVDTIPCDRLVYGLPPSVEVG